MVLGPGLAIFPRGRAAPEIAGRYKPLAHCFHTVCLSGGLRSIAVTLNEEFGINAELRNGVLIRLGAKRDLPVSAPSTWSGFGCAANISQ
jgi:hypothetical protein